MKQLSETWFAEGYIDFELKKYTLLAYLNEINLQLFYLEAREFFGKMLLQVFFIFPESHNIIIMENQITQLGIELVFIEVPVDFIQIRQQRIFL